MSTLNDSDLAEGYWMACDHPERRIDDGCCYHIAPGVVGEPHRVCNGCLIAAQAAVAKGDADPVLVEAMLGHWKDEP